MKEYERDFKGVWIPKEVWLNRDLSLIEKVFFVEIDSLDNEDGCYASNKYFSEFFDISKGRCSQIIKQLKDKGLVRIEYEREGKEIKKRTIRVVNKLNRGSKKIKEGYLENDDNPIKNSKGGYLENAKENNTLINNTSNSNTNKQSSAKLNERFESLWKLYPKKMGKKKAFESYKKAIKTGATDEEIKEGIEAYNKQIEYKKTDDKFIKHGSTWFGNESWNDEYDTNIKSSGYDTSEYDNFF